MNQIRRGATLLEVCVSLAVFLVGTTGLLACWNFFNHEVVDERHRVERFENVLSTMESLVAERPQCADTVNVVTISALGGLPRDSVTVRLKRVPGNLLVWAVVEQNGVLLKRLVRCR